MQPDIPAGVKERRIEALAMNWYQKLSRTKRKRVILANKRRRHKMTDSERELMRAKWREQKQRQRDHKHFWTKQSGDKLECDCGATSAYELV